MAIDPNKLLSSGISAGLRNLPPIGQGVNGRTGSLKTFNKPPVIPQAKLKQPSQAMLDALKQGPSIKPKVPPVPTPMIRQNQATKLASFANNKANWSNNMVTRDVTSVADTDWGQSVADLKATVAVKGDDLKTVRTKFPEFSHLNDTVVRDLMATANHYDDPMTVVSKFPELRQRNDIQLGDLYTPDKISGGSIKADIARGNDSNILDTINLPGRAMEKLDDLANKYLGPVDIEKRKKELGQRVANIPQTEVNKLREKRASSPFLRQSYKNADDYIIATRKKYTDEVLGVGDKDSMQVGQIIANIPGSTARLATGIGRAVTNPADTLTGIGKLATNEAKAGYSAITGGEGPKSILKDRYYTNLGKTISQDPVGVASDIMGAGAGVGKTVAKAGTKLGIQSEKLAKLGDFSTKLSSASDLGIPQAIDSGIGKLTNSSNKVARGVGNYIKYSTSPIEAMKLSKEMAKKAGSKAGSSLSSMISGVDPLTKKAIQANPYVNEYWKETIRDIDGAGQAANLGQKVTELLENTANQLKTKISDALERVDDAGPAYNDIKKLNVSIDKNNILSDIDNILKQNEIKVKKIIQNGVDTGKKSLYFDNNIVLNATDARAIQKIYNKLQNGSDLSPAKIINLRKDLSSLAKYDMNKTTEGRNLIRAIRSAVDQHAKDNIPGLREIDKYYADKITDYQELREGLVIKGGSKAGEYKDNLQNIIKNINNPAKAGLRQRLQEVMPDLVDRVDAINLLPKLWGSYTAQPQLLKTVGQGAGAVGLGYGLMNGDIPMIAGSIAGLVADPVLKHMKQRKIDKIASNISPEGMAKLKEITDKIRANKALDAEAKLTIDKISRQIQADMIFNTKAKPNIPALPEKIKKALTEITQGGVIKEKDVVAPKKTVNYTVVKENNGFRKIPKPPKVSKEYSIRPAPTVITPDGIIKQKAYISPLIKGLPKPPTLKPKPRLIKDLPSLKKLKK